MYMEGTIYCPFPLPPIKSEKHHCRHRMNILLQQAKLVTHIPITVYMPPSP